MRFGIRADLSLNAFLLLEEHTAHFEISDAREHRALHDRSTFVILDISHPDLLIQRDLLGEPLLLEIPNRVIVRIR